MERQVRQPHESGMPGAESATWVPRADRLAPAVDGIEYYRNVRRSLIEARQQVLIVGWELHSEIDLLRGEEAERARREEAWPVRLADLLERLVAERPRLHVWLLIWEGASLFAFERQHLPRMKRPWGAHPRIRLRWDRRTPRLGSQHQKLVVIDDRLAYVGGMDLTQSRWDDHRHEPGDERRENPGLLSSPGIPYHDLMLAVDGEAARALGGWCRERWRRATGERLEPPGHAAAPDDDPWPADLEPLLRDRPLAIVRTQPRFEDQEELRQVEASYLAQIRAARRLVFIETQYFAHEGIAAALAERLGDPDGPEVVLILPYGCPGRIQSAAMDPQRDALLDRLRAADPGGRLCVAWPTLGGGDPDEVYEESVYVHAKTMIVDDQLLRVGSSNLNNRSMGLDAELDVFTQVGADEPEAVAAIAGFRRRLLAYLLHVPPQRVESAERERGSVVGAIRSLQDGRRTLHRFDHRARPALGPLELPIELADPARPLSAADADRILASLESERRLAEEARATLGAALESARRWRGAIAMGLLLIALVLAWQLTPLQRWADAESAVAAIERLRGHPLGGAFVLAGFLVLAALGFPVTVLVASVGVAFAARWAIPLCLLGVAGSASLGFLAGRLLPARTSGRLLGERLEQVARRCSVRGVVAVALLRNVPVAPYALVNVGFGMAGIAWWIFVAGTLLGMLPSIVLFAMFGAQVGDWLAEPTRGGLLKVGVLAVLVLALALVAGGVLRRWGPGSEDGDASGTGA